MEKEELGFTLVEVLISLMILILTSVSLLESLDQAFRHYRIAEQRWRAHPAHPITMPDQISLRTGCS